MNDTQALQRDRPRLSPAADKLAVLVVGMHRSGTSALAGALNLLGLPLPREIFPGDQHNTKGYFEPARIVDFHEQLFASLGSPSNDPLPLDHAWLESPIGRVAAHRLQELIEEEAAGEAVVLFKDPRICRMAPLWMRALALGPRAAAALIPYRHPLEVAASLDVAAGLSLVHSLHMWLQHVLLGERFTREIPRSFVSYDGLLGNWRGAIDRIEADLDLHLPRDRIQAGDAIDRFLSPDMRHHKARDDLNLQDPLQALCGRAWTALQRLEHDPYDPDARHELDRIAAEFSAGLSTSGSLLFDYRRLLAEQYDVTRRLDAQLRAHRDAVEERDAAIRERDDITRERDEFIRARTRVIHERDIAKAAEAEAAKALRTLRDEHDAALARENAMREHVATVEAALTATQQSLDAIQTSTVWVGTQHLRAVATHLPLLRRLARGLVKRDGGELVDHLRSSPPQQADPVTGIEEAEPVEVAAVAPASPLVVDDELVSLPARRGDEGSLSIVFLSGEPETPGHLYRVVRHATAAEACGAQTRIILPEDCRSPDVQAAVREADLLFVWRAAWNDDLAQVIAAAKQGGTQILLDVDDLMFEPWMAQIEIVDGIRTQSFTQEHVRSVFERMQLTLHHSNMATCPTAPLAHRLRLYGKPAFVLPNGFDDEVWRRSRQAARLRRHEPPDGLVRIGYATGSMTHQRDFKQAVGAVARILRAYPQTRLVCFTSPVGPVLHVDEFRELDDLSEQIEWRELVPILDLPQEIARFDINLAPLEIDNAFCESKSELKFYEAALVDCPTIASPTEPFRQAIRHGETGFLASSEAEWHDAIERLVLDPDLRRRVSAAALLDVIAEYGPERQIERFCSLLEQACYSGRRPARAFSLDLGLAARPRFKPTHIPPHRIVFEQEELRLSEVTVIIPLYNYRDYVIEALDSIAAQTLQDLDLVVVDDGSTDDSLLVAKAWLKANADRFNRLLLIRNERNEGLGFTRNVAFANADTRFVLPLDADNRLLPDYASRTLEAIEESGAAFVYTRIRRFGDGQGAIR